MRAGTCCISFLVCVSDDDSGLQRTVCASAAP